MKNKLLKIFIVLFIFYIAITLFCTMDFVHMAYRLKKVSDSDLGIGSIVLSFISTVKFAFLSTIVALIVKVNEKISKEVKNTMYFWPVLSLLSFPFIAEPIYRIVNILGFSIIID